jgi:hypothetical protein
MGLNNEYRDDASLLYSQNDDEFIQDEDVPPEDDELILDPESWHDWHSEDLLNMWMGLRAYLEDRYMDQTLMNKASFHDFCEFVRFFSV